MEPYSLQSLAFSTHRHVHTHTHTHTHTHRMVRPHSMTLRCYFELRTIAGSQLGARFRWKRCLQKDTPGYMLTFQAAFIRVVVTFPIDVGGVHTNVLGGRSGGKTSAIVVEKTAELLQNM